jgi:hypothetical protein
MRGGGRCCFAREGRNGNGLVQEGKRGRGREEEEPGRQRRRDTQNRPVIGEGERGEDGFEVLGALF